MVKLSDELISQLVKVTNDRPDRKSNVVVYGTIRDDGTRKYVQIDGSDEFTPVETAVEINTGDRVTVSVRNHAATITGNISDPAVGTKTADGLRSTIEQTAKEIRLEVESFQDGVEKEVADLEASLTLTSEEIRSEVSTNVANLTNNIVSVEASIRKDLGDDILSLNADLADMTIDLRNELNAGMSDLNTELSNVSNKFNGDIAKINTTIDQINLNVSDMDSKITQTAAAIRSEVTAKVTDINASISDVESGIRNDIDVKVANLESSIAQTATSIRSEVSAEVSGINTSIENVESDLREEMQIEVANLQTVITQTASSIKSEVSADISGLDGRIGELNTKVIQNATSITTLVSNQDDFSEFKQTVEGFSFMGKGGSVKINGGDLNLTGAITFSSFNTEVQNGLDDMTNAIAEAQGTADGAVTDAESALALANTALTNANAAQSDADSAYTRAGTALTRASSAKDAADAVEELAKSIANGTFAGGTFIDENTVISPIIIGGEFYAVDSDSFTEMNADGLYMYVNDATNPKVKLSYIDEGSNHMVQLIMGSGSYNDSSYRNRFFLQKGTTKTGIYYYDEQGNMSGFTLGEGGLITVHGTMSGASNEVTVIPVWG